MDRKYSNLGDYLNDKQIRQILRKEPVTEWSQSLEPTPDYKSRDHIVKLPKLERGFYRVFVSSLPQFNSRQNNKVVQAPFWVSDNVLLIRSRGTSIEGLLVDARDGNPVSEAQVKVYKKGNEGRYQEFTTLKLISQVNSVTLNEAIGATAHLLTM